MLPAHGVPMLLPVMPWCSLGCVLRRSQGACQGCPRPQSGHSATGRVTPAPGVHLPVQLQMLEYSPVLGCTGLRPGYYAIGGGGGAYRRYTRRHGRCQLRSVTGATMPYEFAHTSDSRLLGLAACCQRYWKS